MWRVTLEAFFLVGKLHLFIEMELNFIHWVFTHSDAAACLLLRPCSIIISQMMRRGLRISKMTSTLLYHLMMRLERGINTGLLSRSLAEKIEKKINFQTAKNTTLMPRRLPRPPHQFHAQRPLIILLNTRQRKFPYTFYYICLVVKKLRWGKL